MAPKFSKSKILQIQNNLDKLIPGDSYIFGVNSPFKGAICKNFSKYYQQNVKK